MSDNTLKTETTEIADLMEMAFNGELKIPNFQRPFRWKPEDAVKLFDSILKQYPLGNVLLWDRGEIDKVRSEFRLGELQIKDSEVTGYWIVDGQQRITTMVNCLTLNGFEAGWRVVYNILTGKVELAGQSVKQNQIPLYIIFDISKLFDWISQNPDMITHSVDLTEVNKKIRQFKIPVAIVKTNDEGILREIFDRLNNAGKRLTRAEVFNALQPNEIIGDMEYTTEKLSLEIQKLTTFGKIDENTLVNCVKVITNPDYSRDVRLGIEDGDEEATRAVFEGSKKSIIAAVTFMQNYCNVPHSAFVPYNYLIVVLTRFMNKYTEPLAEDDARSLSRWFWKNILVGPAGGANTGEGRNLSKLIDGGKTPQTVIRDFHMYEASKGRTDIRFPNTFEFRTNTASGKALACAYFSLSPLELSLEDGDTHQLINKEKISLFLSSNSKPTLNTVFKPLVPNRSLISADLRNTLGARYLTATDELLDIKQDLSRDSNENQIILDNHVLDLAFIEGNIDDKYVNERNVKMNTIFERVFRKIAGLSTHDSPISPIAALETE